MQLIGICRLGRNAEVKYTAAGKAVANLSLAFNYGMRDQEGKQPTQWIDASLWGDRAEKLAQYLLKGTQVYVILNDPHIENFTKRDGSAGSKVVAMVSHLEFAGPKQAAQDDSGSASSHADRPKPSQPAPSANLPGNVQDMDDDIPF